MESEDTEEFVKKEYFEKLGSKIDPNSINWTKNYIHLNSCFFCVKQAPVSTVMAEVKPILNI